MKKTLILMILTILCISCSKTPDGYYKVNRCGGNNLNPDCYEYIHESEITENDKNNTTTIYEKIIERGLKKVAESKSRNNSDNISKAKTNTLKSFKKETSYNPYKKCSNKPIKGGFSQIFNTKNLRLLSNWNNCIGKVILMTNKIDIVYHGEWNDGYFRGVGAIYLLSDAPVREWYMPFKKKGDLFIGEFKDNSILNGNGILIKADGSAIVGRWKDDRIIKSTKLTNYNSKFYSKNLNNDAITYDLLLQILNEAFGNEILPIYAQYTEIKKNEKIKNDNREKIKNIKKKSISDEKEKNRYFKDKFNPTISLTTSNVIEKKGIISGRVVDDNLIEEFYINEQLIYLDEQGGFNHEFFIPLEGIKLFLVAYDSAGNKTNLEINFERKEKVKSKNYSYVLNPVKKIGKGNNDKLAIIIGISEYKSLTNADFADRDAKIFAQFSENILGIKNENIRVLLNDKATRNEIAKTLKLWLRKQAFGKEIELFLFYAGHGVINSTTNELFFLPNDTEIKLIEDTAVSINYFFKELENINIKSATFFIDSCFSGNARDNKTILTGVRPITIVESDINFPQNYTIFSASSGNEFSNSLPEAEHGLFSFYLMKGLEGEADINRDSKISAKELHEFTTKQVLMESVRLGTEQNSRLFGNREKILATFK